LAELALAFSGLRRYISRMIEPTHILDRWYAAVRALDVAALAAVTTDDVTIAWNGDPALIPWAGEHRGREAVLAFFQTLGRHLEVVAVTPRDRLIGADFAVVTLDGQWRMRDTDTRIAARACNVFRFRDGRVARYEVYNDTAPFAAALASIAS
jgi:uncharacterized protein